MESTSIFKLFEDITPFIENKKKKDVIFSTIGSRVIDCLYYLPGKYLESIKCTSWNELRDKQNVTLQIYVKKHYNSYRIRKAPYKISVLFDNKLIYLVFFSRYTGYLKKLYPEGSFIFISGTLDEYKNKFQISHPTIINEVVNNNKKKQIKVFYRQKNGLKTELIKNINYKLLNVLPDLKEWNKNIFEHFNNIPTWKKAICSVHNPVSIEETYIESYNFVRLAYDELLATQVSLGIIRNNIKNKIGNHYKNTSFSNLLKLTKRLDFCLTPDQESALKDVITDLNSADRMMRLLHGDVGSGKTIVAFLSALHVIKSNYQVAIMSPTEILAKQQYEIAQKLFKNMDINIEILVSSSEQKSSIYNSLSVGKIDLLLGTHALIQEKVKFKNLSYVIIDEQHRFGVEQRLKLREKGEKVDMLLLSATPIPRTMLLAALGDIDVSTIKTRPFKNRINTVIKSEKNIDEVIDYLKRFLINNEKVFWVCPMIDDDDEENSNVESRYKMLKKKYDKLGILHGRLDDKKKQSILTDFKNGNINLLISTVVIEVGIDIPNANIMLIDQAERFGMAQIHQLRGRIGRGNKNGVCILLYKENLKEYSYERLLTIKSSYDGFDIANKDLQMRGGGDILEKKQYGYKNFIFFDIFIHKDLVSLAIKEAKTILKEDPLLKNERGKRLISLLLLFSKNKAVDLISAG